MFFSNVYLDFSDELPKMQNRVEFDSDDEGDEKVKEAAIILLTLANNWRSNKQKEEEKLVVARTETQVLRRSLRTRKPPKRIADMCK